VFCSAILFRYFNHFSRFIFDKKTCGAFIFIVGNQTQQKSKYILQKTSNYDYLKTYKHTDMENKRLSNASNWYSYLQCFVLCRFLGSFSVYLYPQSNCVHLYIYITIHTLYTLCIPPFNGISPSTTWLYPLYITYYMLVHTHCATCI